MATSNQIEKMLKKQIEELAEKTVEVVGKEIEQEARANFNKAKFEIPADDPTINVNALPTIKATKTSWYRTIVCDGREVLFTEFGAGIMHSNETSTVVRSGQYDIEYAWRPVGFEIGSYGKHQGLNDYWVYRGVRESKWSQKFEKKPDQDLIITQGIRPVRALYRAVGNVFRKLGSGRLKIK